MRKFVGSEEIVGKYVAPNGRMAIFNQARPRTIEEKSHTFKSVLSHKPRPSIIRGWWSAIMLEWEVRKFCFWRDQAVKVTLPEGDSRDNGATRRISIADLAKIRPSVLTSIEGPMYVKSPRGATLAVLISTNQWEAWKKEMEK
jgi:hypothetical protein